MLSCRDAIRGRRKVRNSAAAGMEAQEEIRAGDADENSVSEDDFVYRDSAGDHSVQPRKKYSCGGSRRAESTASDGPEFRNGLITGMKESYIFEDQNVEEKGYIKPNVASDAYTKRNAQVHTLRKYGILLILTIMIAPFFYTFLVGGPSITKEASPLRGGIDLGSIQDCRVRVLNNAKGEGVVSTLRSMFSRLSHERPIPNHDLVHLPKEWVYDEFCNIYKTMLSMMSIIEAKFTSGQGHDGANKDNFSSDTAAAATKDALPHSAHPRAKLEPRLYQNDEVTRLKSSLVELDKKLRLLSLSLDINNDALHIPIEEASDAPKLELRDYKDIFAIVLELENRMADLIDKLIKVVDHNNEAVRHSLVDELNNNDALVQKVVGEVQTLVESDHMKLPDHSLKYSGGFILPEITSRTAEVHHTELHGSNNDPTILLTPGTLLGQCWPMEGNSGIITIGPRSPINLTAFTIEHTSTMLNPDDGIFPSAPKTISVWAVYNPNVFSAALSKAAGKNNFKEFPAASTLIPKVLIEDASGDVAARHLTSVSFDPVTSRRSTFEIPNQEHVSGPKSPSFSFLVFDNWGNEDYTCIYRIRLHDSKAALLQNACRQDSGDE